MTVTCPDSVDPDALAGRLMDFIASDPDDLFPQIETVEDYEYESADD
jgi:hypothetical protein